MLAALGFLWTYFVLKANTFSASTTQIAEGQTVISKGTCALVRHPIYAEGNPLIAGISPALGS
jgi:protein-S-isoprenylcysteine O-methyltransferase Ste14